MPKDKQFDKPAAEVAPAPAPTPAPAPAPAVVAAAPAVEPAEKLVKVRPRFTEPRCRIGGQWYSFTAGKEIGVPKNVAQVLRERNLI